MADQKQADCVKVAIRCRPPSQKELNNNEHSIVELQEDFTGSGDGQVVLNDPTGVEEPAKFAFDIVFGLSVQQETVYESVGKPALQKTFEGYNGTIFAYGQTGSGKSWSMAGAPKPPELRGITPRMNESLFERIAVEQVGTRKFLVMCSYFEIYNEIIFDLLNPVQDRGKLGGGLQIKEHPVMGIYVKDLTEIVAESAEKLEEMLDSGQKSRAVSATMMNSVSSRSHSIFTIKVHQKDLEDKSKNVFAKLNLVDLAGSERQKGTGATGQTLKEGANINKSLSALGNVINALVECANGKKVFIPYRNSKLTRVLQESLGGNSLCTMLATLSPAACNYEETMSTLRYANRAKAIKVTATKNEEASQISRLKSEVEALKAKLEAAAQGGGGGGGGLTEAEREAEKATFERQLREMEKMMNNNWEDKAKISEEHQRKMQRLVEEQQRAAQAVEEERARRFRLLQEKNDLELTVRGFIDLVLGLPKFELQSPGVLTGEQPRQWLKFQRSLRQHLEELSEQRTMALVFRHAFDEDVKLCGEGAQADDMSLAAMGISRCLPKLDKLRKGGEKMLTLEVEGLNAASELAECVRQSTVELAHFRGELAKAQAATEIGSAAAEGSATDNQVITMAQNKAHERIDELDQVSDMLTLVQKQAHERIDELVQLATIEMGHTCEIVLQFARTFLSSADSGAMANIQVLEGLIADPSIASLPPGMPAKPLHQYGAADVSDTAETTEALLSQLVHLESFCGKTRKSASELLARPPPKFILDIACALKAATGFPPDIDGDWPEAREERLARLRRLADTIGEVIGMPLDFFDPADVLKGKEVPKTLRLLQLLAVAAAKKKATAGGEAATSPGKGLTRARELSAMLDVIDRCLRGTKEQVEARRASAGAAATGDGSGMEELIRIAEEQLQEAARGRVRQEEALAGAERELQQSQAEVKKVENECKLNEEGPSGPDAELQELEQQVDHLQNGTANLGNTEAVLEVLSKQLEQVKAQLSEDDSTAQELQAHYDELQAALTSAQEQVRQLEAEAQRERARCETEQELAGQTPEEQKLILAAHEQKLRTRVGTLEAQIGVMHAECEERKGANSKIIQERKELGEKAEESLLQIQIVEEERDSLREAMEQLWKEKDAVEQELQDMQQSYIDLSERVNLQQDEVSDQQTVVERKRAEVAGLQKNGFHSLSAPNGNGQAVVAAV